MHEGIWMTITKTLSRSSCNGLNKTRNQSYMDQSQWNQFGYSVFVVFRKKAKALTSYYYNCTTSEVKNTEWIAMTVHSHPKRRKRQDGIRKREICCGKCQQRIKRKEPGQIRTFRQWCSLTCVKQRERKNELGRNQAIIWRECSRKGRNEHKAKAETELMKHPHDLPRAQ